jgi:GAF domain-containing protein
MSSEDIQKNKQENKQDKKMIDVIPFYGLENTSKSTLQYMQRHPNIDRVTLLQHLIMHNMFKSLQAVLSIDSSVTTWSPVLELLLDTSLSTEIQIRDQYSVWCYYKNNPTQIRITDILLDPRLSHLTNEKANEKTIEKRNKIKTLKEEHFK